MSLKERLSMSVFLLIAALFVGGDIREDLGHGSDLSHVLIEACVLAGLVGMMMYLWWQHQQDLKLAENLKKNLNQAKSDLQNYREKTSALSQGLAKKIDEQLEQWSLTQAEKDIALLILKGLSSKEIAVIRQTAEKTIRQQSSQIYKKANLANRQELAAFFLEDLLVIK